MAIVSDGRRIEDQVEVDRVDLAAVQCTGRLLLFRAETVAVEVNEVVRDVRVTLIRLHNTEIRGVASLKAVVAIQLDECRVDLILQCAGLGTGAADGLIQIAEVHPFMGLLDVILLDHPDEFLTAVIEGQRDIDGGDVARNCLWRCELELFNQIFMIGGDEPLALIRIEIDVIAEELETGGADRIHCGRTGDRGAGENGRPPQILETAELNNEAHGMRL